MALCLISTDFKRPDSIHFIVIIVSIQDQRDHAENDERAGAGPTLGISADPTLV